MMEDVDVAGISSLALGTATRLATEHSCTGNQLVTSESYYFLQISKVQDL
jgi:hypothetical protein